MAQKTPWTNLYKSFTNKASKEELDEIKDWLEQNPENINLIEEIYNIYSISKPSSPMNVNVSKAWQSVDQKLVIAKKSPKRISRSLFISSIAAILIIGLLIGGLVTVMIKNQNISTQYTEIVTQAGQRTSVILPDGSKVWLNSSTSLKYLSNFNINEREVILSGEAFFKVKKDKSKSFLVKGDRLNVKVYGTSFNVKNYELSDIQQVTVEEGIVGVIRNNQELERLTKNQQMVLNKKSVNHDVQGVNTELYTSWRNNELIFRDTPVLELIKTLENWYGVSITIDQKMLGAHNYTFKIKTESLKEVLELMKLMTPFEYEVNGNKVIINYADFKNGSVK